MGNRKQSDESHADAKQELAGDLLVGAAAIAQFMFGNENERRRIYSLAERGQLPVFRLGSILCARKSTILSELATREAATQPKSCTQGPNGLPSHPQKRECGEEISRDREMSPRSTDQQEFLSRGRPGDR